MAPFDIALGIILVFGAFSGFKKGFILEVVSLVGFIIASLAAFHFMNLGAGFIETYTTSLGEALPIVAFVLIFLAVFFALILVGKVVKGIVHLTPFGTLDQLLGMGFGFFKWALFLSLGIWLLNSFKPELLAEFVEKSLLYPTVEKWGNQFIKLSMEYIPAIHQFIESYQLPS